MKLLKKLIPFLTIFTIVFLWLRSSDLFNRQIVLADLGGIPWLYAAVSSIFGIIAAFSIQKEWDQWNNLVDAVHGEVDGLEKLHLWSENFPQAIRDRLHGTIREYLRIIIGEGWEYSEKGKRSAEIEKAVHDLNSSIFEILRAAPELMPTSFTLFTNVLEHRSKRLLFSSRHTPELLRQTLFLGAMLLIVLPSLIGVKNAGLAYIFTASIASLAYSIYLVLNDLNYPLRPGDWHLTTEPYQELLRKLEAPRPAEAQPQDALALANQIA